MTSKEVISIVGYSLFIGVLLCLFYVKSPTVVPLVPSPTEECQTTLSRADAEYIEHLLISASAVASQAQDVSWDWLSLDAQCSCNGRDNIWYK